MARWWSLLVGGPRPQRAARGLLQVAGRGRPASPPLDRELTERRAEAMRRLFPMVSSWRAAPSHFERQSLAYEELWRAADLADLERRERRLVRAGFGATAMQPGRG